MLRIGFTRSWGQIAAIRVVIGVFEAGILLERFF